MRQKTDHLFEETDRHDGYCKCSNCIANRRMTVRPISGKGERFFTAVPTETEELRVARIAREKEEARQQEIARLTQEIATTQIKLDELRKANP